MTTGEPIDPRSYNRTAWDGMVAAGNEWTRPVSSDEVARARTGDWQVVLTPTRPVPAAWFGDLRGKRLLGLASGGGQQGPILAAAGANVTVFDNSPAQLRQDELVARREGLAIRTVQGDMRDLSVFPDASFDLIFHPVSNCFVDNVRAVWREAYRVLRPGGALLAGFTQPQTYCLEEKDGAWYLRYALPYTDLTSLTPQERAEKLSPDDPLEFSHTFTDYLTGQMDAGLVIVDLYEDIHPEDPVSAFMPLFMATRAVKLT